MEPGPGLSHAASGTGLLPALAKRRPEILHHHVLYEQQVPLQEAHLLSKRVVPNTVVDLAESLVGLEHLAEPCLVSLQLLLHAHGLLRQLHVDMAPHLLDLDERRVLGIDLLDRRLQVQVHCVTLVLGQARELQLGPVPAQGRLSADAHQHLHDQEHLLFVLENGEPLEIEQAVDGRETGVDHGVCAADPGLGQVLQNRLAERLGLVLQELADLVGVVAIELSGLLDGGHLMVKCNGRQTRQEFAQESVDLAERTEVFDGERLSVLDQGEPY
ncbi:hypothetical protein METBIDRAFT_11824 [Metschnikowia bicuspidata var. bicuspidata NRRL YB-4993]|uniref:Uncharacterized protein n=1 Tax=Metschnikowia bicuspidata var. bicuspidata NRRL YB-4993 TaxID=869754 RepID=A0A1A0HBM4_9ASCO|nr:hypothetical protein METBIDRAFT_11824 [Metschnikowia bicuspidata var. bicuspidata NRRL YB-4993]OBA21277.1 hypothetical protein METBIDRAFT_11824 [Metschnikowia bicuspidata var. bicuspidata NRRL YB-4993]